MKNLKKRFIFYLLMLVIAISYIYSRPPVAQNLMGWLISHPEFLDGNFSYIDERTNKEITDKIKWWYYDIKEKCKKQMPTDLKEALISALITAYDKIDKCPALDKYRDTIPGNRVTILLEP